VLMMLGSAAMRQFRGPIIAQEAPRGQYLSHKALTGGA
jgi:hypothetical protein